MVSIWFLVCFGSPRCRCDAFCHMLTPLDKAQSRQIKKQILVPPSVHHHSPPPFFFLLFFSPKQTQNKTKQTKRPCACLYLFGGEKIPTVALREPWWTAATARAECAGMRSMSRLDSQSTHGQRRTVRSYSYYRSCH